MLYCDKFKIYCRYNHVNAIEMTSPYDGVGTYII